eukprot:COSAG01_NODE_5025_length_4539_cov_18.108559_2_plen_65_part_00
MYLWPPAAGWSLPPPWLSRTPRTPHDAGLIFGAVVVCLREQLMEQVKQITEVMAYTVQYATRRR